jgi:hypothetical protein
MIVKQIVVVIDCPSKFCFNIRAEPEAMGQLGIPSPNAILAVA